MIASIDDILEEADIAFGLNIDANRELYVRFLERQFESHPEYLEIPEGIDPKFQGPKREKESRKTIKKLLSGKLYLFSILAGKTKVDESGKPANYIDDMDKLHRLSSHGNVSHLYDETLLYRLHSTLSGLKTAHPSLNGIIPSYSGLFNEIGNDPEIVRKWGIQLDYNRHVSNRINAPK